MKSVITASVIFILIIVLISVSNLYVGNLTEDMMQQIQKNEKYISKNNWNSAMEGIERISILWEKQRTKIAVLLNHSYMDKLDQSVVKLKNAVKNHKKDDYIYEESNFKLILTSIMEQQKISIGNIL